MGDQVEPIQDFQSSARAAPAAEEQAGPAGEPRATQAPAAQVGSGAELGAGRAVENIVESGVGNAQRGSAPGATGVMPVAGAGDAWCEAVAAQREPAPVVEDIAPAAGFTPAVDVDGEAASETVGAGAKKAMQADEAASEPVVDGVQKAMPTVGADVGVASNPNPAGAGEKKAVPANEATSELAAAGAQGAEQASQAAPAADAAPPSPAKNGTASALSLDESEQLHWKLVLELEDVHRSMQKWHAAITRVTGSTASDILHGQGRVLAVLDYTGEVSQRDLCVKLGVRPQSLGEVLTKLERQGYVERHASQEDRRLQMVNITDAGRECARAHKPNISFCDFTDEESLQFLEYLERVVHGLDSDCEAMLAQESAERSGKDADGEADARDAREGAEEGAAVTSAVAPVVTPPVAQAAVSSIASDPSSSD